MKKGIKTVFVVFVAAVCATAGYMAIGFCIVPDSSMEPTLQQGDWIIVGKLAYILEQPQTDDVVVYKTAVFSEGSHSVAVGRIEKIDEEYIVVSGDNSIFSQEEIEASQDKLSWKSIKGRVLYRLRPFSPVDKFDLTLM